MSKICPQKFKLTFIRPLQELLVQCREPQNSIAGPKNCEVTSRIPQFDDFELLAHFSWGGYAIEGGKSKVMRRLRLLVTACKKESSQEFPQGEKRIRIACCDVKEGRSKVYQL